MGWMPAGHPTSVEPRARFGTVVCHLGHNQHSITASSAIPSVTSACIPTAIPLDAPKAEFGAGERGLKSCELIESRKTPAPGLLAWKWGCTTAKRVADCTATSAIACQRGTIEEVFLHMNQVPLPPQSALSAL
jgi:hypothetical protein